jgi:hypothetical protein
MLSQTVVDTGAPVRRPQEMSDRVTCPLTSQKLTSGQRRLESVLGRNFRIAR